MTEDLEMELGGADPHATALRLLAHVESTDDGCMVWTRATMTAGYGVMKVMGTLWGTHRLSYTLFVGPIPDDMTVDHTCYERRCVNPDHLRLLTNAENASLRRSKRSGE